MGTCKKDIIHNRKKKVYVMLGQICQYQPKTHAPSQPVVKAAASRDKEAKEEQSGAQTHPCSFLDIQYSMDLECGPIKPFHDFGQKHTRFSHTPVLVFRDISNIRTVRVQNRFI